VGQLGRGVTDTDGSLAGNYALGVHDHAQAPGVGELVEVEEQVVLRLQDASEARQRRAVHRCGPGLPAADIDGVVGLVVPRVRGADLGGPCESTLVREPLPAGHALVAAVERDEPADDIGCVLEDGHALVLAEPTVANSCAEVVLTESSGPCCLPPGLDRGERLLGCELLTRCQAGGGGVECLGETVTEFLGRSAGASAGAVATDARVGGSDRLEAPGQHTVAVAADLLAEFLTLFDGGRLGHGVNAGAAEPLLDAVLAEEGAE
jgi:hypothetical protein